MATLTQLTKNQLFAALANTTAGKEIQAILEASAGGPTGNFGSSGTAGQVNIFAGTAAKGKLRLSAGDSAGDTITTITNASQAAARTYTIPDAGGAASFIMTRGTQSIAAGLTIVTPIISTGLTASGSTANDFSGSTGTFLTSSGANSLSGAVTITAATTPSLTCQAGSTNTGFVTILGKTSGGLKLTAADATAQTVTVTAAAQTVGAHTCTITNGLGVARNFVFNNRTVGASTVALGTNSGTAAALPAGTADVYPTTAADDTVGVILTASDQVTGRTVFVGNGVSNKILKVYPPSGGVINGASADAAFSTASGKGAMLTCLSGAGNTWLAM